MPSAAGAVPVVWIINDKNKKDMKTSRTFILLAVIAVQATTVHAQYATYNHDSPKQNQITVMETGTGALTPELYYWALHNSYKKTAATKTNCLSVPLREPTYTDRWTMRKQ